MASTSASLAWLGLGNMGRGMCKNLVEKGNLSKPLVLYNRTTQRAIDLSERLGADKTRVASSIPEAISGADIVLICVADDPADVNAISTILEQDVRGKLIVDCSTVHPNTTAQISTLVTAKGAEFVACPVFGAPAMADAGQLVCVPSGPKAAVDRLKPFLKGVIGRAVIDFSDEAPNKATLLKVLGNTVVLTMVESLAAGMAVAETTGLGAQHFHEFVDNMFPGPFAAYSKRMVSGDYHKRDQPLFAVDLAIKDASHAIKLAEDSGSRMQALEVVKEHLAVLKNEKGEAGDIAGLYGAVRQLSGLSFDN